MLILAPAIIVGILMATGGAGAEEQADTLPAAADLYTALSHAPVRAAGNGVDLSIYRAAGESTYGVFKFKAPAEGLVQVNGPHSPEVEWTDDFEIAYTKVGDKGPLVLRCTPVVGVRGFRLQV